MHLLDSIVGLEKFIETILKSWDGEAWFFAFFSEDSFISIKQFEINRWCDMINSTELTFKWDWLFFYTFMDSFKNLNEDVKLSLQSKLHLDISQLSFTHT